MSHGSAAGAKPHFGLSCCPGVPFTLSPPSGPGSSQLCHKRRRPPRGSGAPRASGPGMHRRSLSGISHLPGNRGAPSRFRAPRPHGGREEKRFLCCSLNHHSQWVEDERQYAKDAASSGPDVPGFATLHKRYLPRGYPIHMLQSGLQCTFLIGTDLRGNFFRPKRYQNRSNRIA